MAFDLLYHDRRDLTGRPLRDRRARLEDVVANNDLVFPVRRLAADGLKAWPRRHPTAGGGTLAWLKVKVPTTAKGRVAGRRSQAIAADTDGRVGSSPWPPP
jgi:hypothetical protein